MQLFVIKTIIISQKTGGVCSIGVCVLTQANTVIAIIRLTWYCSMVLGRFRLETGNMTQSQYLRLDVPNAQLLCVE